jgi:hypothetical protein
MTQPASKRLLTEANAGLIYSLKPDTGGRPVGKGEYAIHANDAPYGADWTGLVDSTSALMAAEADAYAQGKTLVLRGTYRTSGTLMIRCAVDASGATINYYGDGTAVIAGDKTASGIITHTRRFLLPRVYNKNRGTTIWKPDTVGVELVNLNTCYVHVPYSRDSTVGVKYLGYGGGFAYNEIHLGQLFNNRVGTKLTHDENGWCNQNTVIGGRIQQGVGNGSITDDPESTFIWFEDGSTSISGPNNNTFLGTSLENSSAGGGNAGLYRVIFNGARYNQLINCRFETQDGQVARVLHKGGSSFNDILRGYDSWKIEEVVEPGSVPGVLEGGGNAYYRQSNTSAQVIPTAVSTTVTGWPAAGLNRIAYDGAGNFTPRAGRWLINARVAFSPNATGIRRAYLNIAGSNKDEAEAPGASTVTSLRVSAAFRFDGTQTFRVNAFQNSGGDLALEGSSPRVNIDAECIG